MAGKKIARPRAPARRERPAKTEAQVAAISTQEHGLLDAIWADPAAREPRVVYADFLQQRGDPRGEYMAIRLQWEQVEQAARTRALAIEKKHGGSWLGAARPFVRSKQFDFGGMLAEVTCEADKLIAGFDAIVALTPRLAIDVTSMNNRTLVAQIAALDFSRVYELRMWTRKLDDKSLAALAPAFGRCKRLVIGGSFGTEGLRALERHAAKLEHIQLRRWTDDTKTGLDGGPLFSDIPTIAAKLSFEQPRGAIAYRC